MSVSSVWVDLLCGSVLQVFGPLRVRPSYAPVAPMASTRVMSLARSLAPAVYMNVCIWLDSYMCIYMYIRGQRRLP